MGRHYYVSIVTLAENVPIDVISKMLGHANITTTQIYAKITTEKLYTDLMAFGNKLSSTFKNLKGAAINN